tara:strand:+ start:708 stop:1577 length:870 start_codon:yes stop_codon:yes gene_type:complete
MRDDFCAFILTHGRPDNVATYKTLRKQGYTGKIYLVIDDEDESGDRYREIYGDEVITFSKSDIALTFDEGDNFSDRRAVVYARNAIWEIAKSVGVDYFIELDDDYSAFMYRIGDDGFYGHWYARPDWLFSEMCDYLGATTFATVALSQGGDHIGGGGSMSVNGTKRKAMNAFVCKTDRPFQFLGRINEDTTSYTTLQRAGVPFLTVMATQVNQKATQSNAGGLTDIYLSMGTYIKSFYSVMFCPSAVRVGTLKDAGAKGGTKTDGHARLHHRVDWNACAPKIIREAHKK